MEIPGLELTICFDCVLLLTICWERAMSNKFRRERKDKYAAVKMISASLEQDNLHLVARFSGISRIDLITEILDIPDF